MKVRQLRWIGLLVSLFLLSACDSREQKQEWRSAEPTPQQVAEANGPTLTIGDVDPDTPTSRALKIRPLADHLAAELGWEPSRVNIRVARSLEDMAVMLMDGRVDFYVDSTFPSVRAKQTAGAKIILQSLVDGEKYYRSLIVVRADSDVSTIDDLTGRRLAFQESYSTSGFLVPASMLLLADIRLYQTDEVKAIEPDRIGYLFSGDEENTLAMLRKQIVDAGAISSQDYDQLPDDVKAEFRVIHESVNIPRKLASIRPGFDPKLLDEVTRVLVAIDDEDRRVMVEAGGWNWEFVALDDQSRSSLAIVEDMIMTVRELNQP